jgi:hypothetical protein
MVQEILFLNHQVFLYPFRSGMSALYTSLKMLLFNL